MDTRTSSNTADTLTSTRRVKTDACSVHGVSRQHTVSAQSHKGGRSQDRGILDRGIQPTSSPAAAQRSTASKPGEGKTGSASSRLPLHRHALSLSLSLSL
jgi:hypothetical protein